MPRKLTEPMMDLVAERFRALGDPARLAILNSLRDGEQSVGELVSVTELSQANVSKHLRLLHNLGFVSRRRDGVHVRYSLADREIFHLCDVMCGRIETELADRQRVISGRRSPGR